MSTSQYMQFSDGDDDEDDEVLKDFRNTNTRFQQRLLAAQHDAFEKQIESEIKKSKQSKGIIGSFQPSQANEIHKLEQMVEKAQQEVTALENELAEWQRKRNMEATTSLLTAEERALLVEQQQDAISSDGHPRSSNHPQELSPADVDSIFDYLFEMGRAPPPLNAAEVENNTVHGLMEPNTVMKDKIFQHPDVINQQNFTHITFTKMENVIIDDVNGNGHRECVLVGKAYDAPFSVMFRVSVPLSLSNLDFEVPMDLQMDGRTLLSRIKDEANLHLFFRLIQHYGRLEFDKQRTFDYLVYHYKDTDVRVTKEDANCLGFVTKWDDIQLNLTWLYKSNEDSRYEKLDVNICEQLMPRVRLSVIAEWRSMQFEEVMNQVPERFEALADAHGVLSATQMMVGMILQEPHKEKQQQQQQQPSF